MDEKENLLEKKLYEVAGNVNFYGMNIGNGGGGIVGPTMAAGMSMVTGNGLTMNQYQHQFQFPHQPQTQQILQPQQPLTIKQEKLDEAGGGDKNVIKTENTTSTLVPTNTTTSSALDGNAAADLNIAEPEEEEPEVDIHISNVVCNFSTRCHLNLRKVALNGSNVVYKREQGMISMKIRKPNVTASIWSSGKITVTGATSEEAGKLGCRRIARILQKMGFRVRFTNFRVVNVLGTVSLPFGIKINQFTEHHRTVCSYEPELHPGATYRVSELRAVMKVFQTGALTITAPSVNKVQLAVEHIYPLVYLFKKEKPKPAAPARDSSTKTNNLLKRKRNNDNRNQTNKMNNRKRLKFVVSSDEEEESDDDKLVDDGEEEAVFTDEEEEDEELDLSD